MAAATLAFGAFRDPEGFNLVLDISSGLRLYFACYTKENLARSCTLITPA